MGHALRGQSRLRESRVTFEGARTAMRVGWAGQAEGISCVASGSLRNRLGNSEETQTRRALTD